MNHSDDRALPESMRQLCRDALRSQIAGTSLLHGGLGADFPAPIEWQLHVDTKSDAERSWLSADLQIGSQIQSYDPGTEGYWDVEQISRWLEQHAARTSRLPALDEDIDLLVDAYFHGWDVERNIDWLSQKIAAEILEGSGVDMPVPVSYTFSALNHFYNIEGHPSHRDNDSPVSERLTLVLHLDHEGNKIGSTALCQGNRVETGYLHARIEQLPPWHARMARFDEDLEEWVL